MLNGSLDIFSLDDVLQLVATKQLSGSLVVERPSRSGSFIMGAGRVLGVGRGPAPLEDDDESIDLALELLEGSQGRFAFTPGEAVAGPLDVSVEELLARVQSRRVEWEEVRETLGSLDARLTIASRLETEHVTITASDWNLIVSVVAHGSARAIAKNRGESAYRTAGALAELARRGLLAPAPDAAPAAAEGKKDTPAKASTSKKAEPEEKPEPEPAEPVAEETQPEIEASEAEQPEPADDEEGAEEADVDPIQLLRELVEPETPARRRSLRIPTREEQRMRLRR